MVDFYQEIEAGMSFAKYIKSNPYCYETSPLEEHKDIKFYFLEMDMTETKEVNDWVNFLEELGLRYEKKRGVYTDWDGNDADYYTICIYFEGGDQYEQIRNKIFI